MGREVIAISLATYSEKTVATHKHYYVVLYYLAYYLVQLIHDPIYLVCWSLVVSYAGSPLHTSCDKPRKALTKHSTRGQALH